jgi:hypothetical protein
MSREANERAVADFMSRDWRTEAEIILADRQQGIERQNGRPRLFVM